MAEHKIILARACEGLGHPEAETCVRRAVRRALKCRGVKSPCAVYVTFTDDEGIRAINAEKRNIDSATDVLSFPMNEITEGMFEAPDWEYDRNLRCIVLGDMVIDIPRCQEQSVEFGHSFAREVSYLAVHSTLHLLGYDHMDEGPRKAAMRLQEDRIMASLGILR